MEDLKQRLLQEADNMLDLMKKELEAMGKVRPGAFGICPTGKFWASLRFSNPSQKRQAFQEFDEELRRGEATGAVVGVESWVVAKKNPTKEDLRNMWPSRDPDRQEALVVVIVTKDWTQMRAIPFFRGEMGPVYLDELIVNGGTALQNFVHAFD